ncbi:glutaredoxin-C6-like [Salvia miltiorrhiza]|uniref:glutaredoxin-C6-like n=1 Tax=Salvia miltiorrhiza TaxID=226208 RepID=UPI0025AD1EC8|nr:glutaredoxin-C6-like [Salvia miltiorrhiza]
MQGLRRYALPGDGDGGIRLELTPSAASPLAIDVAESTETRLRRLTSENPVIIFARSACCMCHVMKRLLSAVGVHPTVIELEEDEIAALNRAAAPALYIGGACVGGLESVVALHLNNSLVPKLVEVGVVSEGIYIS